MLETPFAQAVSDELNAARQKFAPIASTHEGYAVILEEIEEFWEIVRQKATARDPAAMLRELVQIATMCQRTAEDLRLIDTEPQRRIIKIVAQ